MQKFVIFCVYISAVSSIHWDHSTYLNEDFRLLWTVESQQDVTFEVQVRTLGYVGLGFSRDGSRSGADIAIGWIEHGQTFFQDRHFNKNSYAEPFVDPSQDYELLLGYENATHTVMRFKRKLDTCDYSHDVAITNDTMRIVYMYHENEPVHGSVVPGSLPSPQLAYKGYMPLSLTQRTHDEQRRTDDSSSSFANSNSRRKFMTNTMELRNEDVTLPEANDETLYWCKVFELPARSQKQHMIKYEPIFGSDKSKGYLQSMVLYECQGSATLLQALARDRGQLCADHSTTSAPCNAIVASWSKGSEGFTFPPEAGYPLDTDQRFYLMETHYSNPNVGMDWDTLQSHRIYDNSGLKLHYTPVLRMHDAGVLSIGMDPNWRHIIPPGHGKVISEGHCIDDCTRKSFPPQGISIFAVIMQTHNIGKEVKLRQIRKHEELLPIAYDGNVHAGYAEYRQVSPAARVYPGDSMVVECTYNSTERESITLGGQTTREESCTVMAVYYPRQQTLSTCHSSPSLPTVLHSLGINELALDSQPVLIASPPELAGMTLESRLVSYDWDNQFDSFQRVTRSGSFQAICKDAKNNVLPGTDNREHFTPTVNKYWRAPATGSCGGSTFFDLPPRQRDSNDIDAAYEFATRRRDTTDTSDGQSMSLSVASVPVASWCILISITSIAYAVR